MLCWPLMPHTASEGNKATFEFLSSRIVLLSAAPSVIHSVAATGAEQPLGDNAKLCHRCPPALSASGRNPPGADCHKTEFFSSPEMLQLSLSTLQAGEVLVPGACQLECSLECSTFHPNCSVPLPSRSQRHRSGPQKSIALLEKSIH